MIATEVQDRKAELAEHLQLLRSLARELERAMSAIARNSIDDLEDSIAQQQNLSAQLAELTRELKTQLCAEPKDAQRGQDDLSDEIRDASGALQTLNQRYAALLQHSSHSVALMVSLYSSFRGQFQEGAGPMLKQQTWSVEA